MFKRFKGIIRDVILGSPIRDNILLPILGEEIIATVGRLLKEDGGGLLLESGDSLLL